MFMGSSDETVQGALDHLAASEALPPFRRDTAFSPAGAAQLATDGTGGVGVEAEVDRAQHGRPEVRRSRKRPEGRFQALDDVALALDPRWLSLPEGAFGDRGDRGSERRHL